MTDLVLISQAIAQLRHLTQKEVQSHWRCYFAEGSLPQISTLDWQKQSLGELNAKNHIAWSKGRKVLWLYQQFVLPEHLQNYPLKGFTLRLALTWWAEAADVYVKGQLVQEGDLFDHSARVILSKSVVPGEVVEVAIRLVSPGHDDGALVRSRLFYEFDSIDPGFVADEIAVLQSYLEAFAPEKLAELSGAIARLDWSVVSDRSRFDQALQELRDRLQPLSAQIKQHTIFLVGHAHLDMAWLWDVSETWKAAERTFTSVLNLQKDFPELTFCHSTPALYEWMEQNRPDLFAQIQQQVKAGRWEIVAGMWIEPELNLIRGESIARQILYGQRYCLEKFGQISRIAWLPDTFGFCGQLPQLFKQGGIDYFVTQKLRWNDTTKFPYEVFGWRSPDGSEILSVMSAPIGEGIDPLKMASYAWDWTAKTGLLNALWLPGVGDHGGGPTRDMLKIAERWQRSPFFPKLEFTTVEKYLDEFAQNTDENAESHPDSELKTQNLPSWNDELYLEFHRGCYTTHADQKRQNRDCETKLYQAELWASLATISTNFSYPKTELETAWKKVLFNQFHDILPGSSIPQVFVDANQEWEAAERLAAKIRDQALNAIAHQIALPLPPHPEAKAIIVFNSLNWERSQVVTVAIGQSSWQIYSLDGQKLDSQLRSSETVNAVIWALSFLAENIPAVGYRCFWVCPRLPDTVASNSEAEPFMLENEFLHVTVDPATGDLSSVFDKIQGRQVLKGVGNQLQAFQDSGQYWDAWNIDPNYAQKLMTLAQLLKIECVRGNIETRIEIERKIGQSVFRQTYILQKNCPFLAIATIVDWQERHVLVKAAFPANLEADYATYETPFGAIQRATKPDLQNAAQRERDKAKWEVPALGWADLSDDHCGVSILSDCKHGYDCQPDQIRLSLLRGSEFPDLEADRGFHSFTYAIYPHAGTWQTAQTVRKSYELNQPLNLVIDRPNQEGILPPVASLLDLQSENLILSAFKQSEENPETYIIRCYECHGEATELTLKSDLGLTLNDSLNILEQPDHLFSTVIAPWKIKSFSVVPSAAPCGYLEEIAAVE